MKIEFNNTDTIVEQAEHWHDSFEDFTQSQQLEIIKLVFNIVDRELFTINAELGFIDLVELITVLVGMVNDIEKSDDGYELWAIGEHGCATLDNLLIGVYWSAINWHASQNCPLYALQCAIRSFYSPGCTNGPEPDSSEEMAYQAFDELATKHNTK